MQISMSSSFNKSLCRTAPLPMSLDEMSARGWDQVDVVFVSGDAYVDHPSFAAPLLGRWLEAHGYRVAILAQPDWRSCDAWRKFGRPRLCFAITAGNMEGNKLKILLFFAIVLATCLGCDLLKAKGASFLKKFFNAKRIRIMNIIIGVGLVLFGLYFIISGIVKFL